MSEEQNEMRRSDEMLTLAPSRLVAKFAAPAIFTMLMSSLYNIVDRIFVGNGVGYLGLSAVTLCNPIMQIMTACIMLIGVGGCTLFSLRLGEKKREQSAEVLTLAFAAQVILGAAAAVLLYFLAERLCLLAGASDLSLPYAVSYLKVIALGMIPQFIGAGLVFFIRAEGNPNFAMKASMSGTLVNCVLDPVFIFGFRMEVAGAAVATVISQAVVAIIVLWYYLASGRSEFRFDFGHVRAGYLPTIVKLGFSSFITQVVTCGMVLLCTNQLKTYGALEAVGSDVAISAVGISTTVGGLLAMFGAGMNQALNALISINYGAKRYDRVRSVIRWGMWSLFGILLIAYIILMIFPGQIAGFFGDVQNMEFTIFAMRGYNLALPLMAFSIIGTTFYQSTGKALKANILSLLRPLLFFIPLLLILPPIFGLHSVVLCAPIADTAAAIIAVVCLIIELRRIGRN